MLQLFGTVLSMSNAKAFCDVLMCVGWLPVLCVFERCAVLDLSVVWGNCEGIMKRPVFRLADDQVHLQAANSGSYKDTIGQTKVLKDPPEEDTL